MGFLDRLLFWRATPARESASTTHADEDRGWRRASLPGSTTLNPDRDELYGEALLREAYQAYTTNPLAYAVIEQTTSFVLGGGATVEAQDPRVQKMIDTFWHDPENKMDLRIYSIHTELSLFGEQFIRYFVDPLTGRTVIRQLDPLYVSEIETAPNDYEKPLRYLYNPPLPLGEGWGEGQWIPAKDILHIAINRVSSAARGRSDLAPILPWIRRYREWLDDRVVLNKLRTAMVWDVTVTGADKGDIDRMRAQNPTPPARGTVLFHSDGEVWKPMDPQIDAADAAPDGRAIRLMIAVGALLPEHYLAEGGNVNRATAAEMGLPSIKRFQRRQELFRYLLTTIVDRVLDEAQRTGRLGPRVDRTFEVKFTSAIDPA